MNAGDWQLKWVVCHRATRSVSRLVVTCPLQGPVRGTACMSCRFMITSSMEREDASWCEVPIGQAPREVRRPIPVRADAPLPIAVEAAAPDWALSLPALVAERAVRPPEPVPSGHPIGN